MPLKLIRKSIFDVPVALIEETNERANKSTFYVLHEGAYHQSMTVIYDKTGWFEYM
jgi:hypothetical protein